MSANTFSLHIKQLPHLQPANFNIPSSKFNWLISIINNKIEIYFVCDKLVIDFNPATAANEKIVIEYNDEQIMVMTVLWMLIQQKKFVIFLLRRIV